MSGVISRFSGYAERIDNDQEWQVYQHREREVQDHMMMMMLMMMMMTYWRFPLCHVHLYPTTLIEPRSQQKAWGVSSSTLWCRDPLTELR